MSCGKFKTLIEESEGGALAADAAAHVSACDSCRAFRRERERLRLLVAELARVDAPADFEFRLRARVARVGSAGRAHTSRRAFVPGVAWLAFASCLVLALGIFVHLREGAQKVQNADAQGATVARQDAVSDRLATAQGGQRADDVKPMTINVGGMSEASGKQSKHSQRTARREKFVLTPKAVEEMAGVSPAPRQVESRSMAVGGSPIYYGVPIPLPVATSERKLEALFSDVRGAQRIVAVDPVTFGAREQTPHSNMKSVSYSGIW
jgi:hypothetical protein